MPVYQRPWYDFAEAGFLPPEHMSNVCLDCHLYHCFGDGWQRETSLDETLEAARTGEGHWPGLGDLPQPAMVSEWSLRLPTWDPSFRIACDMEGMGEEARQNTYRQLGRAQVRQFAEAGAGWYLWTWKVEATGDDGACREPHWDVRECVRRGWLDPRWWGGDVSGHIPRWVGGSESAAAADADDVSDCVDFPRSPSVGLAGGLAALVSSLSLHSPVKPHRASPSPQQAGRQKAPSPTARQKAPSPTARQLQRKTPSPSRHLERKTPSPQPQNRSGNSPSLTPSLAPLPALASVQPPPPCLVQEKRSTTPPAPPSPPSIATKTLSPQLATLLEACEYHEALQAALTGSASTEHG